jgi:hypothetical protein
MCWPDPGEESVAKAIILDNDVAAKRAAKLWAVGIALWKSAASPKAL